jgi:GTP cyclohydrolase II
MQPAWSDEACEVEERAVDVGRRDASAQHNLTSIEVSARVHAEPLTPDVASSRDADLGNAPAEAGDAMEHRGREVRGSGRRTDAEERSQRARLSRHRRTDQAVDAVIGLRPASGSEPVGDDVCGPTGGEDVIKVSQPVLACEDR